MVKASFTSLPMELLVHLIASYLSTEELGALRLTSKTLEKMLFGTFAKEFFTKRQFMLSTASLQTLVNISKHGALNKTLRHVIIGMESFDASGNAWGPHPMSPAQYDAFHQGSADQSALSSSGRGLALLTEAFRNLENLDTVGIRDYEAFGRVRDDARWRSYGAPSVSHQIGFNLRNGSAGLASQTFVLLRQALANARKPIASMQTILRETHGGLMDSAFFLQSTDPNMDAVLSGLRQLLLTLNMFDSLRGAVIDNSLPTSLLESFLLRTPFLEHLRINFWRDDYRPTHWILERLCTTPDLLPVVRRLDLGMLTVMPDLLVQVISKFSATLRHVSLWKVVLPKDNAARWKDSEDRYSPWPRVLQDLATTMDLITISLGCLSQSEGQEVYAGRLHVRFSDGKVAQAYSGDKHVWMPQLLDELVVERPKELPDVSSDEDSVDDDMDEVEIDSSDEDGNESDDDD